jgi:quercetin dioxygenase-like cupin family protein
MKSYRFDAATGRPRSEHGSSFRLSPLTDPDGRARAACFHFEPGDRVGRHEADIRQLFCVVAGEGWAAGPDGARVPIGTGEAALFEPGEDHEAGTDTGMTAIVLEGDFEVWAAPSRAGP